MPESGRLLPVEDEVGRLRCEVAARAALHAPAHPPSVKVLLVGSHPAWVRSRSAPVWEIGQ